MAPKRHEPYVPGRVPTEPRPRIIRRLPHPSPGTEQRVNSESRAVDMSHGVRHTGTLRDGTTIKSTVQLSDSKTQTLTLNRELWDVRRQITALNAREMNILEDLKRVRGPQPLQTAVVPKAATPQETIQNLEAEIVCECSLSLFDGMISVCGGGFCPLRHSISLVRALTFIILIHFSLDDMTTALRERLQREVVHRKLVEDSCESERRRRKHAEGMLDDARREKNTPLVVPAMMDAFQKIAQLTGDVLMTTDD